MIYHVSTRNLSRLLKKTVYPKHFFFSFLKKTVLTSNIYQQLGRKGQRGRRGDVLFFYSKGLKPWK